MEVIVALVVVDPSVVVVESAGALLTKSVKLVRFRLGSPCITDPSFKSIKTTSDIVGLRATVVSVHLNAISIVFFTSDALYSFGSSVSSTKLKCWLASYNFHAYIYMKNVEKFKVRK